MRLAHLLVAGVLSSVVVTAACVPPTNPYDPDTDPVRQARASLQGRVVLEDPNVGDTVLDQEAAALVLRLVDGLGNEQARVAGTDLDVEGGAAVFVATDLVPGSYRLHIDGISHRFTGPPSSAVELLPGAKVDLGDLRYVAPLLPEGAGPGSVTGEVRVQGVTSVPRSLELFRLDEGAAVSVRSLTADVAGRFSFTGLVAGRYAVVGTAEGFAPAYALDLEISEQPGASLEVRLEGQSVLTLQPVSAVLRFSDDVPWVEGVRYTRADSVDVDLLAFGGVTPVTGMRVSTDPSLSDELGAELPFVPHAARVAVPLPGREGPIDIYAQFEARSEGGFSFVSPVFSARVVRDVTPPEVLDAAVAGAVLGRDGRSYLTADAVSPSVEIDAYDAASAISGIDVVESAGAPATFSFDAITAPSGVMHHSVAPPLSNGDGAKPLWIALRDRAGNQSEPWPLEVVVDTTPPSLDALVIAGGAGFVLSPFVPIELTTAATDVAEVALARGGSEPIDFEPFSGGAVTFALEPGDGVRGVVARLRDFAGNESGDVSDDVVVDTGATVIAPALIGGGSLPVDVPIEVFSSAATEMRAAIAHRDADVASLLQGQSWGTTLSTTLPASEEGALRVFAQVRDAVGTESGVLVADVVVDTTAPSFGASGVIIDQGAAATRFVSVTVSIDAAQPEDVDAMALATDGIIDTESFQPFSPRVTTVLPPNDCADNDDAVPDECKSVCVVLRDAAGNVSVPACDTIRLDTTPPTTPTISPLFGTVRADTVEIRVVAPSTDFNGAPVATYEITSPAGDFFEAQGEGPFRFRVRANRDNELCVRGKDEAGNVGIEDCAVVEEATSRSQIANGIDNRSSDIFGDFIAYVGKGGVYLHDIRRGPPESSADMSRLQLLTSGFSDPGFESGYEGEVRVAGDARTLVIAYGTTEPDSSPSAFNVVVRALDGRNLSPGSSTIEGQFQGSSFDTDGRYVAYFSSDGVYVHDLGVGGGQLVTNAPIAARDATESLVSALPITLCPGTSPRVKNSVVVWCEERQGSGVLVRARALLGDPSTPNDDTVVRDELSTANGVALLTAGDGRYHQPHISDRFIVWVEDQSTSKQLVYLEGIGQSADTARRREIALPLTTRNCDSVDVDESADLSGGRLAFLTTREAILGLNDVVVFDIDMNAPGGLCLTYDLPPQEIVSIDGTRVIYRDTANNESMVLVELSRTRWISSMPELAFEPVTSGTTGTTAWLATRPPQCGTAAPCNVAAGEQCIDGFCTGHRRLVSLVARDRAVFEYGDEVVISQNVLFTGPSEGDPTYAVGGERVAWIQGSFLDSAPYTLLAVSTASALPPVEVSTAATRVLALDPDGERIAFVEHDGSADPVQGIVRVAALTATGPTFTTIDGSAHPVPVLDLEQTDNGANIVVWQRGGEDRRDSGGELFVSVAGSPATEVPIFTRGGAPLVAVSESTRVRGPKVAIVGDDLYLAYLLFSDGGPIEPHVCRLVPAGPSCVDDENLALEGTNVRDVVISRDGLVAFTSDEEDIDEIVLFDVRARRRVFATPVRPSDGDRGSPDLAEGHLVWIDSSLGGPNVFEMVLRP